MKAGARVPTHRHSDYELTYVLEGVVLDGTGKAFTAGEAIVAPAGSMHSIAVGREGNCLIAVLHGKIEFLGE
jgi:anti-sigma factor ChrR (cupin superfamily)